MITIVVLERPLLVGTWRRIVVLVSMRSGPLVGTWRRKAVLASLDHGHWSPLRSHGHLSTRVCAVWLTLCYWLLVSCHVLATLLRLQPALPERGRLPSTEEREHNLLSTPAAAAAGAAAIATLFHEKDQRSHHQAAFFPSLLEIIRCMYF